MLNQMLNLETALIAAIKLVELTRDDEQANRYANIALANIRRELNAATK